MELQARLTEIFFGKENEGRKYGASELLALMLGERGVITDNVRRAKINLGKLHSMALIWKKTAGSDLLSDQESNAMALEYLENAISEYKTAGEQIEQEQNAKHAERDTLEKDVKKAVAELEKMLDDYFKLHGKNLAEAQRHNISLDAIAKKYVRSVRNVGFDAKANF
jgi:hypothetical protein